MTKEEKVSGPEAFKFLKSEDPAFSMWTASNAEYPLIEWMQKMERFAKSHADQETKDLRDLADRLAAELEKIRKYANAGKTLTSVDSQIASMARQALTEYENYKNK